MSSEFQRATAVQRTGDGLYEGTIAGDWDIAGNANGGYLIALAARAMADALGRPPLSLTAHYVAPGKPGPCTVAVEVVRAGRRTATAQARLRGPAGDVIVLLGTFGEQQPGGPRVVVGAPPALPPYEACVPVDPPSQQHSGFGDRVGVRIRPEDAGFRDGVPSGVAEVAGWFRYRDAPGDEPFDEYDVMLATDAFSPVCFNRAEFPVGWAPTLELTVHIRARPVPGELRCRFFSHVMQDGMFEEQGEVWDAAGTLVAQSRQLALIPRPFST